MLKKKNKEIVIGSNNEGKIKEIKDLLPKYYNITSPKDYGLNSPKENGNTFLKNSLIKAKYFSKKTKKICIAIAGNLSEEIYKIFEKSDLSGIKKSPNLINLKNKPSLKIRNTRETVKFGNLEFSRIFMAWFIPNLNDQKKIIGLEILASILSVGKNIRLVKLLKEDSNLVESLYVNVNSGELCGLFIMEASCESKDIDLVENQINKIIDEISNFKALTLDEIKKAINIVKSNYIFNLETSTQISSFFGNELLWGRKSSINNLESHLKYWSDLNNFKEITEYIRGEKFTLVASPGKC